MTPRWGIALGAVLVIGGVAIAGIAPVVGTGDADRVATQQSAGGILVLLGWAALAWGIHRFGRVA